MAKCAGQIRCSTPAQSGETISDKGEKLIVKRTEYVPLTM